MGIYNFDQYTPEWWAIRGQRLTASQAQAIGNCGKGLQTYVEKKMSSHYSNAEPEQYTNKDLQRGIDLEPQAGMVYEFKTGIKTQKVGFVTYGDHAGCSPDLLANKDGIAEIKCPKDETYFEYYLNRDIPSGRVWQMQMQMLVCEKKWCDYVVYNPNFDQDLIVKRIYPDTFKMYKLIWGILLGARMIKEIINKYERYHKAHKRKELNGHNNS